MGTCKVYRPHAVYSSKTPTCGGMLRPCFIRVSCFRCLRLSAWSERPYSAATGLESALQPYRPPLWLALMGPLFGLCLTSSEP